MSLDKGRIGSNDDAIVHVYSFLSDTGELDSGSPDMNVDGSINTKAFWLHATPTTRDIYIKAMTFFIRDQGQFRAERFGNLPTLANGCQVALSRHTGNIDSPDSIITRKPIQTNACFSRYDASNLALSTYGSGDDFISTTINFVSPFKLVGLHNDAIGLVIRDDLSALKDFTCLLQGWKLPLNI